MLENFLTVSTVGMSVLSCVICTAASLLIGVVIALIHMYKNHCSRHFIFSLVILPAIVQAVIMLVNGNIGTGVAVLLLLETVHFGEPKEYTKVLKITIPENLDYEGLFEDLLQTYTKKYCLEKVKTVSMGSLYELQYQIEPKTGISQKKFLDEIRCRNGNLTVAWEIAASNREEL